MNSLGSFEPISHIRTLRSDEEIVRQSSTTKISEPFETAAVHSFLDNATELLGAAEGVLGAGGAVTGVDVLIGYDGQVHLFMNGCTGSLETLKANHGARMAYRVSQQDQRVRVEGRAGSRTCLFEAAKPNWAARFLLAQRVNYPISPDLQTRNDTPAIRPSNALYS